MIKHYLVVDIFTHLVILESTVVSVMTSVVDFVDLELAVIMILNLFMKENCCSMASAGEYLSQLDISEEV